MAYPEEGVWKKHHGKLGDLVRAGRFELGPYDIIEWEVRKHQGKYFATNNYFTWAEAWDNAWIGSFDTAGEAVDFARAHAAEAIRAMTSSIKKHGQADPYEVALVVNRNRYEAPPPWTLGANDDALEKAVRKGVKNLGDVQVAREMLGSGQVMQIMKDIEERGGKGVVRMIFGDVCMQAKTGEESIHPCGRETPFVHTPRPVPSRYTLILEHPINTEWTVDLMDEWLQAEIWGSFEGFEDEEGVKNQDLERIVRKLYPSNPTLKVYGKLQVYAYFSKQSMNGPSLGSRDEPVRAHNLIGHVSDWEGTLRTYKALTAIARYHPHSAGQIAQIFLEEQNPLASMTEVQFPMFLENKALFDFVMDNLDRESVDRAGTYFVTHWDLAPAVADMWRLSPELQATFPSKNLWVSGINLGEGWFDLLDQVRTILRRAE